MSRTMSRCRVTFWMGAVRQTKKVSEFSHTGQFSGRTKLTPFVDGGVAAGLESSAGSEVALLVEVAMDRAGYRGEFLQTSHLPEASASFTETTIN